jgi:hypothetical protein
MPSSIRLFVVMLVLSSFGACVTPGGSINDHLTLVAEGAVITPQAGKALIYFMRPSFLGSTVQPKVYDGTNYAATVSAKTRVPYQATPGKHLFMVVGESADFMEADLVADKTYYALVTPRAGINEERFSLRPIDIATPTAEFTKWINETKPATVNDKGYIWAKENSDDVLKKRDQYLPKWQAKPEGEKPRLPKNSFR